MVSINQLVVKTAIVLLALMWQPAVLADSIETVDAAGDAGDFSSLALDSSGNPVVSYQTKGLPGFRILHCNDVNCAGGDESIETVDSGDSVGVWTSLALDSSGNPVVSHWDLINGDLKILHCNDVNCAGGDESIEAVDTAGVVGNYSSLALDSSGNPVVSYHDGTNGNLKILHCNDVNCAGGDESIETVDNSGGNVGEHTSLVLDSSGFPVVSYYNAGFPEHLKVLHCNDVNCAGGDESIESVDTAGNVGRTNSLALDSSGNPVVSYWDLINGDLKILHCNDVNCAGGDESIESVDTAGNVGASSSLALDSSGNPVVSYHDGTNNALKILHCNDVNCTGGDESIETVDNAGAVGFSTSLVLDSSGNPVVSYYDLTNTALKVLHCNDVKCAAELTVDIKPGSDPNSINLKSKGHIPVAIITTESFDATQVDFETVEFGLGGATETHGRAHVEDVDEDGDMDLLLHFNTQDTGIACGDTEALLTGEVFGGEAVRGSDSIVTVHCD